MAESSQAPVTISADREEYDVKVTIREAIALACRCRRCVGVASLFRVHSELARRANRRAQR